MHEPIELPSNEVFTRNGAAILSVPLVETRQDLDDLMKQHQNHRDFLQAAQAYIEKRYGVKLGIDDMDFVNDELTIRLAEKKTAGRKRIEGMLS